REGQPVIFLPDPRNLRVRVRINESKVAQFQKGMKAQIIVDAFHDRTMIGTVDEVTPIPAPANGPFSDVRIYFATVNIDNGGFDDLRPGLSADVHFLVNASKNVTRVPLRAIRWVDNQPYAAVASGKNGTTKLLASNKSAWEWRRVALGQSDSNYAEVTSGLKVGEQVVARPELLPSPAPTAESTTVADASDRPRH
ncbi:MAG: efflux RND transporter periplasmic adaptor subunit, partial [Isosphaeraceae bacterium]